MSLVTKELKRELNDYGEIMEGLTYMNELLQENKRMDDLLQLKLSENQTMLKVIYIYIYYNYIIIIIIIIPSCIHYLFIYHYIGTCS